MDKMILVLDSLNFTLMTIHLAAIRKSNNFHDNEKCSNFDSKMIDLKPIILNLFSTHAAEFTNGPFRIKDLLTQLPY